MDEAFHNNLPRRILRNSALFYFTEVVHHGLNFLVLIYAARTLTVNGFGDFTFALAILALVGSFSDFGLSILLVKNIAKGKATHTPYNSQAARTLIIKVLFTFFWLTLALLTISAKQEILFFIFVVGAASALRAYAEVISAILKALEKFHIESLTKLLHSLIYAIAVVIALKLHAELVSLAVAIFLTSLAQFVSAFIVNARGSYLRLSFARLRDWAPYAHVMKESLPFGILSILGIIYFRVDTLMLHAMKGSVEVGLYNAAYKILEGLLMIPWSFSTVLFPVLSEAIARKDMETARKIVQEGMRPLAYFSIPLATGVTLIAPEIIRFLYPPEYEGSVLGLQVLVWAIVPVFMGSITSILISASASPQVNTWIAFVMVILNVGLNLIGIPLWSLAGAASATVITEFSGILINRVYIQKQMFSLDYRIVIKPCIAACVMAIVMFQFRSLALLPVYVGVYLAVLIFIRGLSRHDLKYFKALIAFQRGSV